MPQYEHNRPPLTYKDSGVDITAGNELVKTIGPMAKATARPGADAGLGGFGALFDLKAAGYTDPILVSATDGVGTKLKIAIDAGIHNKVGIDLVAMCVNDLVVQGAEPLFFLDYFGTGHLENHVAADVIQGIAAGCSMAGCALIGGETAELPGLYAKGDYDLAGFTVGAVERSQLLTGRAVQAGNVVLGIASSGVHSNGYSLVRRVVERTGLALDAPAPFSPKQSLAEALLTPTRIYVKPVLKLTKNNLLNALAHITGGGLLENIPRVLPDGLGVTLDAKNWPLLPVFQWLKANGNIDSHEMARTFNCGIGMVLIADAAHVPAIMQSLQADGETVYVIGQVTTSAGYERVVINNMDTAWH